MNPLEVRNLRMGFWRKKVLEDISFIIEPGKIVGYVGRNAAGKTTTIKTIMGLYAPENGEVSLFGEVNQRKQVKLRENVGYVPEDHVFYDNLKVKHSCEYISSYFPKWDRDYEKELIKKFDLDPEVKFKNLSRGQKAKLFLLFALAHKPELIIMDEPTSHLDPVARNEFWETTIDLIADTGASVFISTHLINDIERIADQYILLKNGFIEFQKDADDLKKMVKITSISSENLENLSEEEKKLIIRKRKISKGYEIFVETPFLKGDFHWESTSIEEILISYLMKNGEKSNE